MTIFRGPGGTGSATSDSDTTEFQEFLVQSQAARDAALAAQVAAELAETNAETAETNAETAATNAASSASAAASSASSASTSASNASTSASAASTSATNAASSASSASSSASAASTSASNAATSATNASNSASSASTSATNAANSASTATTQATNAASSATAAASSASSAATSATNAANSASSASTSATNAATSATSAAASASAAAASAASIDPTTLVRTTGTQTIGGDKTFSSNPTLSAGTANGVAYLNGSKVLTTGSALTFDGSQLDIPAGTAAAPSLSTPTDPNTGLFFPAADTIAFSEGGVESMRLDSSGNVGIGTSSPSNKLTVSGTGTVGRFISSNTGVYLGLQTSDANGVYLGSVSNSMVFQTNDTERARIDSSGNLLVGTTTVGGNGGITLAPNADDGAGRITFDRATTTASSIAIVFENAGTTSGQISYTNTATTYSTSSDYRLKENIAPMTGALAKVAALKPCTYKWKADGSDGEGFIAHELAEVAPQCVTGEKDAVDADGNPQYQGIDTSFLVATLTAAIQEQQAIITAQQAALTALTARVTALESN